MTIDWYVCSLLVCGLAAQFWVCLKIGKFLGRLAYAAVAAASFTLFAWACGRVHGFRERSYPHWIYAPHVWFAFLLIELGSPARSIQHMGGHGVWNGIGDWQVAPREEAGQ